ncbi:MAG: phosphoribosylamine--glycine ligase [Dehalococcoidia bacterium]|nr:phosphoribosylamine--glycine ligase [Dehalococcoidia bacterium]
MRVLLIGGGGREHAIAWKLSQSPHLTNLYIAPGNSGTAALGRNLPLPMPKTGAPKAEIDAYLYRVTLTARDLGIDLVFVAPEDPLAWGLIDRLENAGIAAFGPSKAAAALEASKSWAKAFMARHDIPHPTTASFDDLEAARDYVRNAKTQLVVKADGLAVGKGAIVTSTAKEALQAVDELMVQGIAGTAGSKITIEERIGPREVSGHAFSDGKTFVPMPLSCDHKAVFDGNQGPNTGGMGVYSPPWWADDGLAEEISRSIIGPAVEGMRTEGRPFKGIVYPGVMATERGPQVFEFNARFGDPETQALLVRLKSDLLEIVWACANGNLKDVDVEWSEDASVTVALASDGYPAAYKTGLPISGVEEVDSDVAVFHAGARRDADGTLVTAGGRVLNVTATGKTLAEARQKAYANVERIHFEGMHYRRDIGLQPGES